MSEANHPTPEKRFCTCHPDDRPPICQQKFASHDCQASYAMRPFTLRELITHDLKMAATNVKACCWWRVRMYLWSAVTRPYWHRRLRHV